MFSVSVAANGSTLKLEPLQTDSGAEQMHVDVTPLVADGNHITSLAASPIGGVLLLCGTHRGNVAAWALAAGATSSKSPKAITMEFVGVVCAHAYQVRRLRFCASGERAVSCSDDCTSVVFDLLAGVCEPKRSKRLIGHRAAVTDAHFTADRTRVVSVAADGNVLIHVCADGSVVGRISFAAPIVSLALSADETLVYACSRDAVMRADLALLYRPAVDRNCSTSTQSQFVTTTVASSAASQLPPAVSLPIAGGSSVFTGPLVAVVLSHGGSEIVAVGQRGAMLRWRVAERIIDDGEVVAAAEGDEAYHLSRLNKTVVAALLAAPRASAEGVLHVPTLGWASWHAPAVAPTIAPLGTALQRFAAAALAGIEVADPTDECDESLAAASVEAGSAAKRKRDPRDARLEELQEKQRRQIGRAHV